MITITEIELVCLNSHDRKSGLLDEQCELISFLLPPEFCFKLLILIEEGAGEMYDYQALQLEVQLIKY